MTLQPGESKVVSFEATPQEAKDYHVSVDGLSGSFKVIEAIPELVTFSVEVYNIPSYAAGSYQWYIDYGGEKHGMIDPQAGIWTPIDEPIVVADVKPSGALRATLHAGPYQSWYFTASRTFRDGEVYRFNLTAGILEGPGIALTDLVVEPDYFTLGESVTISVMATNTGEVDEQREVIFIVEDTEVGRKTVKLGPQESKEVSIEFAPSEVGVYFARVEALTARFEVKEFYPDIAQPELVSIEWLPEVEWSSYSRPKFQGTILLPAPGKDQWYLFKGLFQGGEDGVRYGDFTYLSAGLWSFEGATVMPYYTPQHQCLAGYYTKYYAHCGICKSWWATGLTAAEARANLERHFASNCYEGMTSHCRGVIMGREWTTQEPSYYLTNIPCMGTKLTLTMQVLLMEQYIDGIYTKTRVAKTWNIPTGLDLVVDRYR